MNVPNIISSQSEIQTRLNAFGLTKSELQQIAIKAITAKNGATTDHPPHAGGYFAYAEGTRALRETTLCKPGWEKDNTEGIASVINKELNIKIIYQNVDLSCSAIPPKAISGKGNASKRIVDNGTMDCWEDLKNQFLVKEQYEVWYLCVSSNEDEIRCELSRPFSIEQKQFEGFIERVYIFTEDDFELITDEFDFDDNENDFNISITKKI